MPDVTWPIDETRTPLCCIKVWAPGQARGFVGLRDLGGYDILRGSAGQGYGTFSYTSGARDLECLALDDKRGALVSRPQLVFKDTNSTQFSLSGGAWEARAPSGGRDGKTRLVQYRVDVSGDYLATSNNLLPANPTFAVSMIVPESSLGAVGAGTPPYSAIEIGAFPSTWRVEFSKVYGARLMFRNLDSGVFEAVSDLPEPDTAGNSEANEFLVAFRYARGCLGVSTDFGKTYKWVPTAVPPGKLRVGGAGGILIFGVHQLAMAAGTWDAAPADPASTDFEPLDFLGSRYDDTYGTVGITDTSAPADSRLSYRVSLTPTTAGSPFGWAMQRSPEVYTVLFHSAPTLSFRGGGGAHDTEYTGAVEEVTVEKPEELDQDEANFTIRLDPDTDFSWARGRLPTCTIELGHGGPDGDTLERVFTGCIDLANTQTAVFRDGKASFQAKNLAYLLKLAKFSRFECYPFSGFTLNQARDRILNSEGIPANSSFRQWSYLGDYFILGGEDSPEEPFAWPKPGECKWDFMQRLAGLAGLEMLVDDYGVYFDLPIGYAGPVVVKTYEANPTADLSNLVKRLRWSFCGSESRTAIIVEGTDAAGRSIGAYAVDQAAETLPASVRFTPVRLLETETLEGTCGIGMLHARVQALARERFQNREEVDLTHPVDLGRNRRDLVKIDGFNSVGVPVSLRFVIRTLTHRYTADPSMASCETTAGLRLHPDSLA